MLFTKEMIEEIRDRLSRLGIKDTQIETLDQIHFPITGEETVVIVKNGRNVRITLNDLYSHFPDLAELIINLQKEGSTDIFNVSAYLDKSGATPYVTLEEAITSVPEDFRKIGLCITFANANNEWGTWQYTGTTLNSWSNVSNWRSTEATEPTEPEKEHNILPFDGFVTILNRNAISNQKYTSSSQVVAAEYTIVAERTINAAEKFYLKVGDTYYTNWEITTEIPITPVVGGDPLTTPEPGIVSKSEWYYLEYRTNKLFYNRSNKVVYCYNYATSSLAPITNIQVVEENAPEEESILNPDQATKGSIVVDLEHDKLLTWDGNKWKEISGGKSAYELAFAKDSTIGTEEKWLASLNGTDGKSAYELWLEEPNNAGKSIDAFWAYLSADKGYTKQVLTYAEFSALSPQTADTDTIYVYPNADNTEYYNVISDGTSWISLITNDGEIADYAKIKAALLKSSSSSVERRANLEIGGINGNLNSNTNGVSAIRSVNSFLITNSNVTVGVHSNSGNYYPKVAAYNGCDANGKPAAIKSNSDAKYSMAQSLTDANVGSYLRFIIYVYSDSAYQTRIETITEEILNDIYVSSTDSQGVVFDTSNSTSNETSDDEFYNVADIAEEVALNKSKIERIESGENDKIPSTESENRTITSYTAGSFNASGIIVENQTGYNRGVSDYIDVSNYISITVGTGIGGTGAARVGAILYDENQNIIDDGIIIGTNSDGSLSSGTIIDVSKAKYIRFGLSNASVNGSATGIIATSVKDVVSDIVNANVIERIEGIEDSIADVPSDTPHRLTIPTENEGFLANNGTVTNNTNYHRGVSDYILIDKIWKIVTIENIYAAGGGSKPFICLYDANKTALTTPESCKAEGDANGKTILTTTFPPGAKYMRISFADYDIQGVIDVYKTVSISERLEEIEKLAGEVPSVESKFLVIGSSSVQRMEDTAKVGDDYKLHTLLGIDSSRIVMSGVGGEDIKAITARLGSEMITNSREFTIPADTSEVDLGLKDNAFNVRGSSVSFNTQAVQDGLDMPKLNPIYIDGIKCSIRSDGTTPMKNRHYWLKRDEAGEEAHTVIAGTQIFPENIYRRDYVLITALGYNAGYTNLADYLDYHDKALMFCESRRFIFMGRLYGTNWGATSDMLAEEAAMELKYGYNYFNVRKFLVERGVEYARKLSLYDESNATQDAEDMANGKIPTSLHGGPNDVHLTNNGYKIVNYRLAEIIKCFGWDVKGNYAGGSTSPSNSTPVTPSGEGEANVIEVVKVNGTALTVTDKSVDIPVPAVHSWALAENKPSYNASEVGALPASTTIPVKASSMSNADNDNFITPALALGAFDRKMQIINAATYVDNNSNLAVNSILNSYCILTVAQNDTVTLVLPDITNSQQLTMNAVGCVINATIGTGGDIALSSAAQIYTVYENGFSDMEAGKMYEINILCIGNNTWAVTAIELKNYPQSS